MDAMARRMSGAVPQGQEQQPQGKPADISSNTWAIKEAFELAQTDPDLKEYAEVLEQAFARGLAKDYRDISKGLELA